jgi:hypothetical protein
MARRNSITKFLQDVIDDSKDLLDDLIERAEEAEESVHDAVRDAVDDDDGPSGDELAELRASLADLAGKVDKLASAKAK